MAGRFATYLDINAIRLDPRYVTQRYSGRSALAAVFIRLAAFARKYGNALRHAPIDRVGDAKPDILLFSSTYNQVNALAGVQSELSRSSAWLTYNQPRAHFPAGMAHEVSDRAVHTWSLVLLPMSLAFIIWFLIGAKAHGNIAMRARAVAFALDEIIRTPAYIAVGKKELSRLSPRVIVMSNDHNSINRAICSVAAAAGVERVYVQHAPVSGLFPPLCFDHALVDGDHAATIYRAKGGPAEIVTTGAGRYRAAVAMGRDWRARKVGLGLNKLDLIDVAARYVHVLESAGFEVIVRPHPGMRAGDLGELAHRPADRRPLGQFLEEVDVVIAGSSGLLLDAYMAGVMPVAASDLSRDHDYYGFAQRHAVISSSLDGVAELLNRLRPKDFHALQPGMSHYNAAITTKDDVARRQAALIDRLAEVR